MDLDKDEDLSSAMGSKRGSKISKKTWAPENRNSNQKEGKGNAKEDNKKKSLNGS